MALIAIPSCQQFNSERRGAGGRQAGGGGGGGGVGKTVIVKYYCNFIWLPGAAGISRSFAYGPSHGTPHVT